MGVGPWNGWVIAAGVLPGCQAAEDNFKAKAIVRSEMCARLVCATKGNSVNKARQQWQGPGATLACVAIDRRSSWKVVTLVLRAQSVIYVPLPNASTRRYSISISTSISIAARAKTSER